MIDKTWVKTYTLRHPSGDTLEINCSIQPPVDVRLDKFDLFEQLALAGYVLVFGASDK